MEYGTREVGLEAAAAATATTTASDDESSRSSSGSGSSSNSSTADWPVSLAGLQQQQQQLPGGAALLLSSLYSLQALQCGRLWPEVTAGETTPDAEAKEPELDPRATSPAALGFDRSIEPPPQQPPLEPKQEASEVLPTLGGFMLSAYTSMLGRLSVAALAAAAAAAAANASATPDDPDDATSNSDSSSSERSSIAATSSLCRSRESSGEARCRTPAGRQQREPAKRRKRPKSAKAGKEAAASSAGSSNKRSLALQRVRYRYEREEYRCGLCSYACTIEKAFERHLRAHARGAAREGRVSCAVCGADRASELELSKHMRRHRDNRYFCCDICVFRTVQLKKLIQHRRMHTGEKPHLCPHCSYRSARRDNLRSHVRRVHKKENLYQDTFSPRPPSFLEPQPHSPRPSPADPLT